MANTWVRLWLDMPNDPKWRTIARVSGRSISEVIAVFIHLIVDAANATERGRTQVNHEDVATALDVELETVASIVHAMQGRVLDGDSLKGWNKRQPEREDNSAERSKAWRIKQKELNAIEQERTQPNATERNRTQDKDKDKDNKKHDAKVERIVYAENVSMTAEEHERLVGAYGESFTAACVAKLSNYKGASGKKYKNDYRAILTWVVDEVKKTFNGMPNSNKREFVL